MPTVTITCPGCRRPVEVDVAQDAVGLTVGILYLVGPHEGCKPGTPTVTPVDGR